jgi:hypothetical protein
MPWNALKQGQQTNPLEVFQSIGSRAQIRLRPNLPGGSESFITDQLYDFIKITQFKSQNCITTLLIIWLYNYGCNM